MGVVVKPGGIEDEIEIADVAKLPTEAVDFTSPATGAAADKSLPADDCSPHWYDTPTKVFRII